LAESDDGLRRDPMTEPAQSAQGARSGSELPATEVLASGTPEVRPPFVERRILLALVLAALVVHARVVGATFTGDDFRHLFESEALPFGRFLLRTNGDQFMLVHNVLFVLFHETVRLHSAPYYAVELATHLVNVALFYKLLRRIGCSLELSALVTFLWGTAPVHQGTMRWFSVYQALLATTTTLGALLLLSRAIAERRPMRTAEMIGAALALWLGAATVGGATAVALLFPAVAWLTLPDSARRSRTAAVFVPIGLVGFVVPRLLAENVPPLPAQVPRLLAALVSYGVGAIVAGPALTVTETGVGVFGRVPLEVPIAAGALAGLALLALVAVFFLRGDGRERRFVVGMFLFAGAQYGAVAVARSWWAAFRPVAWLATRDRYHYSQGLLLSLGVAAALRHARLPPYEWGAVRRFVVPALAAVVALDAITAAHADAVGEASSRDFTASVSASIRTAAHALPARADLYLYNEDFRPVSNDLAMGMPRWQFPGIGAYWFIDYGTMPFEGHRIRFVERSPGTVADLRANVLPDAAALFVTADEAGRTGVPVRSLPDMEAISKRWWDAQDPELRAKVAEAMRSDESAAGQFRRALERDPKAMEDFRRALQRDPAAMEALRREMAKQARENDR